MPLLWQRVVTSHRLFITSYCRPSFLPFRFCPSLGEALYSSCFSLSLKYPHQHALTEILLGQSPELGRSLPRRIIFLQHPQRSCSIKLHFRDSKGQLIKTVEANEGDDILSIAHEHDIDLEGVVSIMSGSI